MIVSQKIYDVIETIANVSARTGKEALLRQHADTLKPILQATYNPYRTYGINKVPEPEPVTDVTMSVAELLDKLADRELTGTAAQLAVAGNLYVMEKDCAELLRRILKKDLRMGVSVKTINKVIPGCVPEFGCMQAQPFDPARAKYPMIAQPKLDGVRVIADVNVETGVVQWFSGRSGQLFTAFDHLNGPMLEMVEYIGRKRSMFDGEIITGSFNKTVSEARRKRSQALDAQYHIFDWIDEDIASRPYRIRYGEMLKYLPKDKQGRIQLVEATLVHSQEEVDSLYQTYLERGFEGAMLKDPNAHYHFKRSYAWMKMKEENSIDTPIIDWELGTGKYEGLIGALVINHNGTRVKVGSGLSDELRSTDPDALVGRLIEVSYQHETPDGSLRHPRFKRFRDLASNPGVKV